MHQGAVAKPELKAALEELGMEPTHREVADLMEKFDSSGQGLLDLPDFKNLVLTAVTEGRKSKHGEAKGGKESRSKPGGTMLKQSGRRHPATRRVQWQSIREQTPQKEEEAAAAEREFFPDEEFVRKVRFGLGWRVSVHVFRDKALLLKGPFAKV
jgi:hypothetical protein